MSIGNILYVKSILQRPPCTVSAGRDELWNAPNNQTLPFITSCIFKLAPCSIFVNLDALMCFSSSYGLHLDISLTVSASNFGCKIAHDATQWLFLIIEMTPAIFYCYFCPITHSFLIKYVLGESNSKGKCDDFFIRSGQLLMPRWCSVQEVFAASH